MSNFLTPPRGQRSGFKRLGITMPPDLILQIKKQSIIECVDVSQFVRNAVNKYLAGLK